MPSDGVLKLVHGLRVVLLHVMGFGLCFHETKLISSWYSQHGLPDPAYWVFVLFVPAVAFATGACHVWLRRLRLVTSDGQIFTVRATAAHDLIRLSDPERGAGVVRYR